MAWSPEISQLSTDVTQLTDAVNVKKNQLSGAVTSAQTSKASANTSAVVAESGAVLSAASMQTANTHKNSTLSIYGTQVAQQASIGTAAAQASAAATSAVTATTGLTQDLSGVTAQALHRSPNAVTSMFVYDTSKDSDGGAWTEKCQHTSWWNEPIMGKWLGQQISEFQARNAGATVGPELITNGDFSGGSTGWTVATGWSIANSEATFVGGTAEYLKWPSSIIVGKLYKFTFTIKSVSGTAPSVSVYMGQSPSLGTFVTPGTYTVYGVAIAGSLGFAIRGNNANVDAIIVIDSVSVREVISLTTASTDYFQLTTDGKFYRLWNNTFTWSDQFDNAAWRHNSYTTNLTITPNAVGNPVVGALSGADLLVPTTTSAGHGIQHLAISGGAYVEVVAKASGYSCIAITDGGNNFTVRFDLTGSGTTVTETGSPTEVSILALSDGWYRCRLRLPNTVQGGQFRIYVRQSISGGAWASYAGDGTSGVLLASAQQTIGSFFDTYEAKSAEGSISEVFRGNKRDFPRLAGIVGEANSISIYDLTEPGRPMWMRLNSIPNSGYAGMILLNTNQTGIAAVNGNFILGGNGPWQSWCTVLNFVKETGRSYGSGGSGNVHLIWRSSFANRHTAGLYEQVSLAAENIAGATTNAVAATVLPDAPTDPVTGLRVPTIAIATSGGVSVIKHNGTVVNSAQTTAFSRVVLNDRFLYGQPNNGANFWFATDPGSLTTSFAMTSIGSGATPAFRRSAGNTTVATGPSTIVGAANAGSDVSLMRFNRGRSAGSIFAYITNTHNTGWMPGDIRRCFISENVTGSLVSSALSPNVIVHPVNTNSSVTTVGGTYTLNAGSTGGAGNLKFMSFVNPGLVAGILYKFSFRVVSNIGGANIVTFVANDGNSYAGDLFYGTFTAGTTYTYYLTAWGINTYLSIGTQQSGASALVIDNLVFEGVTRDLSYKATSATINGTLTRIQLASGTSLVGYSNWSNTNYLREPYNADLDFGTGEFSASTWVNIPSNLSSLYASFPKGPNLMPNGTFDTPSGWTQDGVTISNGVMTGVAASGNRRGYISLSGGTNPSAYEINADVTGAAWSVFFASGGGNVVIPIGTASRVYSVNTNADSTLFFMSAAAVGATIDNVSVYELLPLTIFERGAASGPQISLRLKPTGQLTATIFDGITTRTVTTPVAYNNATWIKASVNYTTDGSLAILVNGREVAVTRGTPLLTLNSRYNLLNGSEQFQFWTADSTTITPNAIIAPNGQLTAAAIVENSTSSISFRVRQSINTTQNSVFSVHAKYAGRQYIVLKDNGGLGAIFDLINGTFTNAGRTGAMVSAGNGWWRCSISGGPINAIAYLQVGTTNNINPIYNGTIGLIAAYVWGAQVEIGSTPIAYQRVISATNFDGMSPLTIGNNFTANAPFPGSIALLKLSATVPTPEQESFIYEQEKQLFRAGTQSVLPDANAIIDMSYDDATDRWAAVSTTNESYWNGLVRSSATAVPAGAYSKITTTSGIELVARTTTNPGVDVSIPPYALREELVKRSEAASKLARKTVTYDYVGGFTGNITTGSTSILSVANLSYPTSYIGARISGTGIPANTTITGVSGTTIYISAAATATTNTLAITFLDFNLPAGMEAKVVLTAGVIKREGSTSDYTRLFDGFIETIRFAVAPGSTAWVQIQATRTTQ